MTAAQRRGPRPAGRPGGGARGPADADAPLAPLTTLRVGGPADRLVTPRTRDELLAALALAREPESPPFMLGNGSDVVVADAGIRGLVVRNRARDLVDRGHRCAGRRRASRWRCSSGAARQRRSAGIEFGISIPGSLGGAVWANAGAHGGEMAGVVTAVEAWDPADGALAPARRRGCARSPTASRASSTPARWSWPRSSPCEEGDRGGDRGGGRWPPGAARRDAATGRPERGQRLPQPAGRPCRAPDRRGGAEGHSASGARR